MCICLGSAEDRNGHQERRQGRPRAPQLSSMCKEQMQQEKAHTLQKHILAHAYPNRKKKEHVPLP